MCVLETEGKRIQFLDYMVTKLYYPNDNFSERIFIFNKNWQTVSVLGGALTSDISDILFGVAVPCYIVN